MFVLLVSMRIRPGSRERFLAAMADNAASSLREEPGCLRFDVVGDTADTDHILLYEVYADEDAFAAHKATPHFSRWRTVAPDVLAEDQVNTRGELLFPPVAP